MHLTITDYNIYFHPNISLKLHSLRAIEIRTTDQRKQYITLRTHVY